ncbi:MAG: phosphotransferase [Planctomycetota bacterium]
MPAPLRDLCALARDPAGLDRDWAQGVVAHHAPGARVRAVLPRAIDVGTTTRVALEVDHDAPDLPRRWFVKLPSRAWRARAITALPQLPQTEVRFYAEVAPRLPIPRPRCLAAIRRPGRGFTLVLEDVVARGARVGTPTLALSAEEAGPLVELLAFLHAELWEAPALRAELAWLAGPVRRLEDRLGSALALPLIRRGLRRAGDAVPASLRPGLLAYARARRPIMAALGAGPACLVHHDVHPGNLCWDAGGPALLDWQLVRIGEGVSDVAYLLATCLEPEVRRAAEPALLARYRRALVGAGVTPPADLEARYAAHLCYPLEAMLDTLAIGGLMDDAAALGLVRRAAAACADHDAFAVALAAC